MDCDTMIEIVFYEVSLFFDLTIIIKNTVKRK